MGLFALFSEAATSVDLCLLITSTPAENVRIPMTEHTDPVWRVFLPDVAGRIWLRVYGPYPERVRFQQLEVADRSMRRRSRAGNGLTRCLDTSSAAQKISRAFATTLGHAESRRDR
jgi:pullulanase/glycogen debranching enzyme